MNAVKPLQWAGIELEIAAQAGAVSGAAAIPQCDRENIIRRARQMALDCPLYEIAKACGFDGIEFDRDSAKAGGARAVASRFLHRLEAVAAHAAGLEEILAAVSAFCAGTPLSDDCTVVDLVYTG